MNVYHYQTGRVTVELNPEETADALLHCMPQASHEIIISRASASSSGDLGVGLILNTPAAVMREHLRTRYHGQLCASLDGMVMDRARVQGDAVEGYVLALAFRPEPRR